MRCVVYLTVLFVGVYSEFSLTEEEKDCLAKKEVFYKGKCYRLGGRGPCEKGQIFTPDVDKVLSEDWDGSVDAVCQEPECKVDEIFWPETEKCVNESDSDEVCGISSGRMLIKNEYGNAECTCKRSPVHVQTKTGNSDTCYLMYHQGPCRDKFVVGFMDGNGSGKADCIPDKCYHEKKRRELINQLDPEDILVQWTDGKCYELDTQGPCPSSQLFEINLKSNEVGCTGHTLQVIEGGVKKETCSGKECGHTLGEESRDQAVEDFLKILKGKGQSKRNKNRNRTRSNGRK